MVDRQARSRCRLQVPAFIPSSQLPRRAHGSGAVAFDSHRPEMDAATMNPETSADKCGFCRSPILPTANKMTINGTSYHAGCWDRQVHQADNKKA